MLRRRRPADDGVRDWSHVTSREAASVLVESGQLEPMLLLPESLGGEERPENVVFVPRGFNEIRDRFLAEMVIGLVEDDADSFDARPEYKGDSFVPSAIRFEVRHSEREGRLNQRLDVW